MSTRFLSRRAAAFALAAVGYAAAAAADLVANRSEVGPGETLTITLNAASTRTGAGYLAVQAAGAFWFVNESGTLVPYQPGQATPRRLNGMAAGSRQLFSFVVPPGMDLPVTFHAAFGRDNVDVLATAGAVDLGTLESTSVVLRAVAGTPTGGASGKSLYALHCASCHGANPAAGKYNVAAGGSAPVTLRAIQRDLGGMGYLRFLSDGEIAEIASYITRPN